MIYRFVEKEILRKLRPGTVVCLLGARRTGKTVLMKMVRERLAGRKVLMVQGDNLDVRELLSSPRAGALQRLVKGYDALFIDEAQAIPGIGQSLKVLVDTVPRVRVFITGSSSLDLKSSVGEPLVGRGSFLHLYPVSQLELARDEHLLQTKEALEERLLYGAYPEVLTAGAYRGKRELLTAIRDGYLLKDILALENLKDSLFVFNLLRMLAFQIGRDVSCAELAGNLNVHSKTVRRYLELLEKTFVIFSLSGFSRNLRKEYTKSPRYFFWDNGIRNVLISNFNPLNMRDDTGPLWENYCIAERLKKTRYQRTACTHFFWRSYDQKEIDLLEERQGRLFGYEMKWRDRKTRVPKAFLAAYPEARCEIITPEHYLDFIA